MYTLEDLDKAIEVKQHWDDKFFNDSSNNPNKYQAQRRDAEICVQQIRSYLKSVGIIEKTEDERLNEQLDTLYPNAKSKTIVEYQGSQYQVRYFPVVKSRSRKTVKEWGHSWHKL
ncbi:hypothetical protein ACVQ79_16480 [Vibrio cholerae]